MTITASATTNASVYDGTTLASVNVTPDGILTDDLVTATGIGKLFSANAGSNTVAVSGMTLAGDDADNYALASTSVASTDVTTTALALTGGTISSATSVYGSPTTVGTLSFDNTPVGGSAVGTATLVNPTYSTGGFVNAGSYNQTAAASTTGNYTYAAVTTPTANDVVTPLTITASGITAADKVYDATTSAVLDGSATVTALGTDVVTVISTVGTFDTKDVGTDKVVTWSATLAGADAANYSGINQAALSADITPALLTVTEASPASFANQLNLSCEQQDIFSMYRYNLPPDSKEWISSNNCVSNNGDLAFRVLDGGIRLPLTFISSEK